jgi:hypothetical protein
MKSKLMLGLLLSLVTVMLLASSAMAAKLLCVSQEELKGGETVSSCLARGEQFGIMDEHGVVHILTPSELELTKKLNPKIFEQPAFSIKYRQSAPNIPPLPVSPYQ